MERVTNSRDDNRLMPFDARQISVSRRARWRRTPILDANPAAFARMFSSVAERDEGRGGNGG